MAERKSFYEYLETLVELQDTCELLSCIMFDRWHDERMTKRSWSAMAGMLQGVVDDLEAVEEFLREQWKAARQEAEPVAAVAD